MAQQNTRGNNQDRPSRPQEEYDTERERQLYYAYLADPANRAEIKTALGPHIDLDRWLASAREAVEVNPKLLAPSMRQSLLFAVKRAARQTLRPDGKQGAIIPRYNSDAKALQAVWQPMIQGVLLLGRRAGVLKSIISADIVFAGEPFKRMGGDTPSIVHEVMMDIREEAYSHLRKAPARRGSDAPPPGPYDDMGGPDHDAFWDRIVGAYAVIEGFDGSRTRRTMGRTRLLLLRDFAKRQGGAVWSGPFFDEMIVKSVLHFAMKHVDTFPKDEDANRLFREALDQDTEMDFDDEDDVIDSNVRPAQRSPAALPAPNPADKLNTMEAHFNRQREREPVTVSGEAKPQQETQQSERQPEQQQGQRRDAPRQQETRPPQQQQPEQQKPQGEPPKQALATQTRPPANKPQGTQKDSKPQKPLPPDDDPAIFAALPGLVNDDHKKEGLDNDAILNVRAARKWVLGVVTRDLPAMRGLDDMVGFEINQAVSSKRTWMAENAPKTLAVLTEALAHRRAEFVNARNAA